MLHIKCILTENFNLSVPKKCNPLDAASLLTAVAPSVVSTLGNIGSSIFGYHEQKDENQANRDWQERMWHMNNAYNTPLAQRERLEEAGYNPYLLTQDASASGQSVMSSSPASSPLPGFGQPFSGISQALQQGLQVQSNIELQHTEAMEKLYGILFKAYEEGGQELFDKTSRELAPTLERFDWQNSPLARKLEVYMRGAELENVNLELDNSFKELENRWYGVIKNDEHRLNKDLHNQYLEMLNKIKAEVRNIDAMTEKTLAEKEKILAEKVGVLIDNGLKGLDFENAQELQGVIQDTAYENLWALEDARHYRPFDKNYDYQGKTGQYFPLQSGQFGAAQNLEENRRRDASRNFRRQKRNSRKK